MKADELLNAMSNIDEDLIAESILEKYEALS